ncbi:MAG: hypothetical protein IKJ78_05965 [Bacteroidales bacterium]|nr:hypothetical protein [Bacteroidales bacterium]
MAKNKNEAKPVAKVRCCDCSRSVRDTSGHSFSIITGEFFMGTCPKGHGDGIPGRVFMDKARICTDHI